ncbi:Helix-turn-helix [Pustulibacterium marinum]|uniref:Helix-turn-helix n=1 Tax=Pustulibacterium marinum TaxID=1224947 RepID=A0A1I7IG80_9FLAO|nr:helix-turn-helix transcriptional regulator [Pustulibacterium marinum]SFU71927.1 Helix-turn-helix [Pustulibacterium marinum]
MVNNQEFSKRLQIILEHYHLSASAFADSIDVQRSSISHILSGRNKPSLDFVLKVIQTYSEVDLYWLLNGKGTFPPSKNEEQKLVITKPLQEVSPSTNQSKDRTNDLFSNSSEDISQKSESISEKNTMTSVMSSSKKVERIVIFYADKTFETYLPNS